MFKPQVTTEKAKLIERNTRLQSKSRLWHEERKWRITASKFGQVVNATARRNMSLLCKSIFAPKDLKGKAVMHGRKYEARALKKLEEERGVVVQSCGLFVSAKYPYLAATPDGITTDHIIEVKCPYKGRNEIIRKSTVYFSFLEEVDGKLNLKKNHSYFAQIQGQLLICGREKCVLVVYTFVDCIFIDISLDHDYCENILLPKLSHFYTQHYRPYVANIL